MAAKSKSMSVSSTVESPLKSPGKLLLTEPGVGAAAVQLLLWLGFHEQLMLIITFREWIVLYFSLPELYRHFTSVGSAE